MIIWSVVELALLMTIVVVFITQILIPLFTKQPYFWLFRREQNDERKEEENKME